MATSATIASHHCSCPRPTRRSIFKAPVDYDILRYVCRKALILMVDEHHAIGNAHTQRTTQLPQCDTAVLDVLLTHRVVRQ